MARHGTDTLLHDGAPCHKAKKVTKFLQEEAPDMKVIDWPGNSPDCNPIENAWNLIKDRLRNRDTGSVEKLKEAIKDVWCREVPADYWRKLSDSMPTRMKLVIQNNGNMTKY